ncbi:hypothetical protein PInf_021029 [Phytophthora infestans]|nr:hypothetical protein PInf_021029 [Phytophthora infestans]
MEHALNAKTPLMVAQTHSSAGDSLGGGLSEPDDSASRTAVSFRGALSQAMPWRCHARGGSVGEGVWRPGGARRARQSELEEAEPQMRLYAIVLIDRALTSASWNASKRSCAEALSIEHLQVDDDVEVLHDFQVAKLDPLGDCTEDYPEVFPSNLRVEFINAEATVNNLVTPFTEDGERQVGMDGPYPGMKAPCRRLW